MIGQPFQSAFDALAMGIRIDAGQGKDRRRRRQGAIRKAAGPQAGSASRSDNNRD